MTDKELIKQEIENLKAKVDDESSYSNGWKQAIRAIEIFIDSLPEESGCEVNFTTKSEDFESEWKRYINSKGGGAVTINVKDIARHFAEWQKQKDLEDLLKSDMTMPNKFYEKGKADAINEMKEALQIEYEKGRFDMREEMMKDAADSKITTDGNSIFPIIKYQLPLTYDCKIGDKVKLIIIKEKQQ